MDPDRIGIAAVGADAVVSLDGHATETVPGRWLRDHGDDPVSVDPRSRQRVVDTFAIDADVAPVRVDRVGGDAVVEWTDGTTTSHDLAELAAVVLDRRHPAPSTGRPLTLDPRVHPWSGPPEPVPAARPVRIVDDDEAWAEALGVLHRDGWLLLEGADPGPEPVERLAARLGYVRRSIFGDVWAMEPGAEDHLDSAYDTTGLDVHTDGTYSHDAPGTIIFSLQERNGRGGHSLLVDGFAAAADLAAADPPAADLLTRFAVRSRYLEPGVHLVADRSPLRLDAQGVLRQVTFNNYDRAPLLPAHGWVDAVIDAYATFRDVISDPGRAIELEWMPGRVLVVDNWRLLHGRTAYTGSRRFLGAYTNHEDLESAWRRAGIV